MATIPDWEIHNLCWYGGKLIEPYNKAQVQPASYDLRLGNKFRVFNMERRISLVFGHHYMVSPPVDVADPEDKTREVEGKDGEPFEIKGFALGSTVEKVRIPANMVARVEGKSSLARLGLFVHVTAGFIDPGFEGHITLELFCANGLGIVIYPGMPIAQIAFERMDSLSVRPYGSDGVGSKYQGQQDGPAPSRYYKNFPLEHP